jgi:hypothetical protein
MSDIVWTPTPAVAAGIEESTRHVTDDARSKFTRERVQAPTNAKEAQERLDLLSKDPDWGKRLFTGDGAARKEFDRLHEIIAAGQVLDPFAPDARARIPDFQTVGDGEMPFAESVRHVETLREIGMPDALIREAMTGLDVNTGKPFTPEMVERARQAKRIMESPGGYDPTDVTSRNRMMAVNIILANAGG